MISNKTLINHAEQIFAHTAAYQFPALFANRETTFAQVKGLMDKAAREKQTIVISEGLGSGKTFLVDMIKHQHGLTAGLLRCGQFSLPEMEEAAGLGAVFVDECDIKTRPQAIKKTMEHAAAYWNKQKAPLFLIGDYTLRDETLLAPLKQCSQVTVLELEPLNPEFLFLAISNRIGHVLQIDFDETILAPELVRHLTPDWKTTPADFRGVLRILMELSYKLPVDDADCLIGAREVKSWLSSRNSEGMSQVRQVAMERYYDWLGEQNPGETELKPQGEEELRSLMDPEGNFDDAGFSREILQPLARGGALRSMGIPTFEGNSFKRHPAPYLPSLSSLLYIAFLWGIS